METKSSIKKNPSRETCERTIRHILSVEILEHGRNTHFKQASDFMGYFQSLYPASPGLTKQVQRALKAMDMPRDADGYYIPNKSKAQLEQEDMLRRLFAKSESSLDALDGCEPLFLGLDADCLDFAMNLIHNCETFHGAYVAVVKSANGLLFFTRDKKRLSRLLESLL